MGNITKLQLLVTGTGRCGTVYMSRLLSSLGIQCGHESIFNSDGWPDAKKRLLGDSDTVLSTVCQTDILTGAEIGDGWLNRSNLVAESSYMAAPFLCDPLIRDVPIIHIIRNPLEVISSFVKDFEYFSHPRWIRRERYHQFIYSHLPALHEYKNPVSAAVFFYLHWNIMIESQMYVTGKRYLFQRIEDMPSDELFEFVKIRKPDSYFSDTKVNSQKRRTKNFALDDIPDEKLRDHLEVFMRRHKYPIACMLK